MTYKFVFASPLKLFLISVVCFSSGVLASPAPNVQVPQQPVLRIETGQHLSLITKISANASGRYVATASEDKTVRIWDGQSGRLLQVLRPPIGDGSLGTAYAVALSPDNSTVAVGGNSAFNGKDHAIYLFDRATGSLRKGGTLSGLEAPIHQLAWSQNSQLLAIGLRQEGLRVFRNNLKFVGADPEYNDVIYGIDFAGNDRLVTASLDGALRLYRIGKAGLERLARVRAPGGKPYTVAFSPDSSSIAVGYLDSSKVDVLDAETLTVKFSVEYKRGGNLGRVAWSTDGRILFAGGTMSSNGRFPVIAFADGGRAEGRELQSFGNIITSLTPLTDGIAIASADSTWSAIDARGNQRFIVQSNRGDFRDNGNNFRVSNDGLTVSFSSQPNGRSLTIFDARRGELVNDSNGMSEKLAAPRTSSSGLTVDNWKNSEFPKLKGKQLSLLPKELARSLAAMPDGSRFTLGTEWYLRTFEPSGRQIWEQRLSATAWAVNYSGDGRWVIAALADGTIRWYRASDGQEQIALFPHSDGTRWALWTPSGYYDTSVNGENLVGWHLNRAFNKESDFFSVGRFRAQYYRPEVLQKLFLTGDLREAMLAIEAEATAAKSLAASIAQPVAAIPSPKKPEIVASTPLAVQTILPPVVELHTDTQVETDAASVPVTFSLRSPSDAPATEVKVRVDGKLIHNYDARSLNKMRGGEMSAQQMSVPVPQNKDSDIVILAKNKNGISEPITIHVKRTAKAAGDEPLVKMKKLYLLAVGVSNYANKDFQLGSPDKDAKDFASMFEKHGDNLYEQKEIRILQNEQATSKNVLEGLQWLQKSVGPEDMGILFLAGHGVIDPETNKYFFASHDLARKGAGFDSATYVSGAAIQDLIAKLHGRGIIFLDTCHSGNALDNLGVKKVLNEADDEKGVAILSASGGNQLAIEDAELQNGAFTYAIKEGVLKRQADYEKDGRITPPSLLVFVSKKMKEMTKKLGAERPQTPKLVGASFNEPFIVIK